MTWDSPEVAGWAERGRRHRLGDHEVFVADVLPSSTVRFEPLVVIHGYPTSSLDFAGVVDRLAEHRRVVLVDLLGYGLSDKPDAAYTMAGQADVVAAACHALGVERLALLTHDMGDTVGGELLARNMDGSWPVEITKRVVTNGSIYIDLAHLTAGQQFLLSLPDEPIADGLAPNREALARSLVATLAAAHADVDMAPHAELIEHAGGNRLLARTIRYIEERRSNERRFTGAIESHPSPLHIVWGPEDPIAVAEMVDVLARARPDATVSWVEGAGHYPQLEEPGHYCEAVLSGLG